MAKTDMTLHIEQLLKSYSPKTIAGCKLNKFRETHLAFECVVDCGSTKGGIVDLMRVDEILTNQRKERRCGIFQYPGHFKTFECLYREIPRETCDYVSCALNFVTTQYDNEILFTAYEIKVTKADFHSSHGHNFCGNANYYVMPDEVYAQVKDEIPPNIGVVVYKHTDKLDGLMCVKQCEYQPLDDNTQKWLLMNVLKKKGR